MKKISSFTSFFIAVAGLLLSIGVSAAEPVAKSRFSGVAIGGHDTVAYHELA